MEDHHRLSSIRFRLPSSQLTVLRNKRGRDIERNIERSREIEREQSAAARERGREGGRAGEKEREGERERGRQEREGGRAEEPVESSLFIFSAGFYLFSSTALQRQLSHPSLLSHGAGRPLPRRGSPLGVRREDYLLRRHLRYRGGIRRSHVWLRYWNIQ